MSYRLAFYGDDFTGSTDAMEALTLGGVPTVLLLEPWPPEAVKQHFPHIQAIGLAGTSRAMTVAQMNTALPEAFEYLKQFQAEVVYYKVCSTFDSSPEIGSIGRAIELGLEVFGSRPVPMVVGAPILKRYVAFSNLFATVQQETFRLDRHPTMRVHPVTPMQESDLRLHLAQQTDLNIQSFDVLALERGDEWAAYQEADVVIFDTINTQHLIRIGQILAQEKSPYWVGSSGMAYALIAYLQSKGGITPQQMPAVNAVRQLLVISGSAAPGTAAQIAWAEAHGFASLRLDSIALMDNPEYVQDIIHQAAALLQAGQSVILYSAKGPDDPMIASTRAYLASRNLPAGQVSSRLGKQQGYILKQLLEMYPLPRVCVSGGDTCGHVVQQLGLTALELLMPIAPGSPLCKAHSRNSALNGLEISLKAGQVGQQDYFGSILTGQVPAAAVVKHA